MSKQKFTLDISAVMQDEQVLGALGEMQPFLREQLIESYSPVLARFEQYLAKGNLDSPIDGNDKADLVIMIREQLKVALPKGTDIDTYLEAPETLTGGSNANICRHYGYLLNAINQNKTKIEIATDLKARFEGQFIKDFPFRHAVRVVDQNGQELSANINKEI